MCINVIMCVCASLMDDAAGTKESVLVREVSSFEIWGG